MNRDPSDSPILPLDHEDRHFLRAVLVEASRARAKFPSSDMALAALVEEVGELAAAMLSETPARVRAEAVQVAFMAMRIANEGDPSFADYRGRQDLDAL